MKALRTMRKNLSTEGGKVERDDERMIPAIGTDGLIFEYAHKPEYA